MLATNCWAWCLPLVVVCIPSEIPLEKLILHLQVVNRLTIAFGLWMATFVYFLSLCAATPFVPYLCRSCECCHSLCEFICFYVLLLLESLVSLVSSIPCSSHNFLPPIPEFLEPLREGFDGDVLFMT